MTPGHRPELDGVRGAAALAVFLYHGLFWFGQEAPLGPTARALVSLARPGWLGVDLFFVLSGMLITGRLIAARPLPLGRFFSSFYARRALRILPLYYLVLVVGSLALWSSGLMTPGFVGLSAIYMSNVALLFGYGAAYPLVVLWSLAVEEHFYLVWPGAVRFLTPKALMAVVVGVCVVSPIVRAGFFLSGGAADSLFLATWCRLDGLAWGALLTLVMARGVGLVGLARLSVALAAGAVAMGFAGYSHNIGSRTHVLGAALQFTCADMFFAGLIGIVMVVGATRHAAYVRVPALAALGRISYCFYLVHQLCFWTLDRALEAGGLDRWQFAGPPGLSLVTRTVLAGTLALAVSMLSFRFIENPCLRMRSRFPARDGGRERLVAS